MVYCSAHVNTVIYTCISVHAIHIHTVQCRISGPAGLGRAGPEFLLLYATSPQLHRRAASLPAASPQGLDCVLACAAPRRAVRWGADPARAPPRKLIKVYTWCAHWCAGGRQSFLKIYLSVTVSVQMMETVCIVAKKSLHHRLRNSKKKLLWRKKVNIDAKKNWQHLFKICQKVHMW
jgi:hypothetical protein